MRADLETIQGIRLAFLPDLLGQQRAKHALQDAMLTNALSLPCYVIGFGLHVAISKYHANLATPAVIVFAVICVTLLTKFYKARVHKREQKVKEYRSEYEPLWESLRSVQQRQVRAAFFNWRKHSAIVRNWQDVQAATSEADVSFDHVLAPEAIRTAAINWLDEADRDQREYIRLEYRFAKGWVLQALGASGTASGVILSMVVYVGLTVALFFVAPLSISTSYWTHLAMGSLYLPLVLWIYIKAKRNARRYVDVFPGLMVTDRGLEWRYGESLAVLFQMPAKHNDSKSPKNCLDIFGPDGILGIPDFRNDPDDIRQCLRLWCAAPTNKH